MALVLNGFYCAGDWIDADLILGDAGLLSSPWEDSYCYLIPSEKSYQGEGNAAPAWVRGGRVKVAIVKSLDATWSQGYYPASDFVLLGYQCTYGDLAQADELIEDAGLADEYDSTFSEENLLKVIAVLRINGYEVTLPANWPHPQDDAPHTE